MQLATELFDSASQYAAHVVDVQDPSVAPEPYGPYIHAQRATSPSAYQLPEPILHPVQDPAVLVIGINPGFGGSERIPCLGTSLDDYGRWYAHRFDAQHRDEQGRPTAEYLENGEVRRRFVPHYTRVENWLLAPALGPGALGRYAVYCDAIPWKWANQNRAIRPQMSMHSWDRAWDQASHRVETIVIALAPKVIVTLGEPGPRIFNRAPSAIDPFGPAQLGDWFGQIVAAKHPAAQGVPRSYWDSIAERITHSLN
jgi:hypothetical protein